MSAAKKRTIVPGYSQPTHKIVSGLVPAETPKKLSFGFTFFKEIENFGLRSEGKQIDNAWMLSFVEKLGELGRYTPEELRTNPQLRQNLRHHKIDWQATNIPIRINDLNWVSADYRNNPEFPFWQFQVSKATGRFVGFYDEQNVFQIVLVDPLHNVQPAGGKFAYKVNSCFTLGTVYEQLCFSLQELHRNCQKECTCCLHEELNSLLLGEISGLESMVTIEIPADIQYELQNLEQCYSQQNSELSHLEIFCAGIESYKAMIQDNNWQESAPDA